MFGLQSEPAGVQAGKGRHAENDDCRMFIKRTVHSDVGTGADTFEGLAEGGIITAPGTGGPRGGSHSWKSTEMIQIVNSFTLFCFQFYRIIVDLQCCVCLRYIAKWFIYICIYVLIFFKFFSHIGCHKKLVEFPVLYRRSLLDIYLIYSSMCVLIPSSWFIPSHSDSPLVTISLFSPTVSLFLFSKYINLYHFFKVRLYI